MIPLQPSRYSQEDLEIFEEIQDIFGPKGVQLDWKAYYDRFDAEHGGYPVEFRGKLLWRDGFTYSSTSLEGPEWAPPPDPVELKEYQNAYWVSRRNIAAKELVDFEADLYNLRETQRNRSVPLQKIVRYSSTNDDGFPIIISKSEDLNFEEMEQKLKSLRADVAECDEHLSEISHDEERARASSEAS